MSTKRTRIRAKLTADGVAEVFVLVNHPMETGQRVDPKTKEKIPAHFIQKMTFLHNDKEVAVLDMGPAVSRDPLLSVRLPNAKRGDTVRVFWSDNFGQKDEAQIILEA